MAEWLGRGLQNLAHRFNSGPRLSVMRTNSSARRAVVKLVVVVVLLILAAVHLLFAGANFGIGEPAEGGVALVAGGSLLIAVILAARGAMTQAALCVLLGTLSLTVWFLFTVPLGWSSPSLLYASLPVPTAAALYLTRHTVRR